MFEPQFRITGEIAKALMAVEADRQAVIALPLSVPMLESLRRTARLLTTHLSTQIEGNLLSPRQVQAVIEGEGRFPGRERDETEVLNHFAALEHVEKLARTASPLTETEIRTIHGLVMTGRAKATRYRPGQNVLREARTGRTVYLPPEAGDVPTLMKELVRWVNDSFQAGELPAPIVAAIAHYQFATIHPYYDGNGRTARLLTNLLLHRHGFGLNGIYCLEEYYAANLPGYYSALAVGNSHNYYYGRAEADVTGFVRYFCTGMAAAFAKVRVRAGTASGGPEGTAVLRELTPQQRHVLGLFRRLKTATRTDIARFFKLPPRQAYRLCARWLKEGFLEAADLSTKNRTYRLADHLERLVAGPGIE